MSEISNWLLDSDPALRWQVERDLLDAPASAWQATQSRVATEGVGYRLLSLQDLDGQWAGGAYFPRDFDFEGPEAQPGAGQPWTATTWSLNFLRDWGMPASAMGDTAAKLEKNSRWEYEQLPYWDGEVDCCINGFTLMNGLWLGRDVSHLAQWFVDHQMDEGGWNCEWVEGATRASVHSTLNSLKAIIAFQAAGLGDDGLNAARMRAEEYLLERALMRKLSGESLGHWVEKFQYPLVWRFSTLNALDYFRSSSLAHGTKPDARLAEAIESVLAQQQPDGTWLQGERLPGRMWFEFEVETGQPSKWLTFYAMRVLRWWNAQ